MDITFIELRQTIRSLCRGGRFTLFALLNLVVGLGATIAIYSTVRTVLLDPLPYHGSDELVAVWSRWSDREIDRIATSGGDFRALQREAKSFEGIAAVGSLIQNLTGGDRPEQVTVGWVSENFFDVFGVSAYVGRTFQDPEPIQSLILSHHLWRSAFHTDSSVVGRAVSLDGVPFTVVGVLPEGFRLHLAADAGIATDIDAWRPPDPAGAPARWSAAEVQSSMLRLVGRLRKSSSLEEARQEVAAIAGRRRGLLPDHAAVGHDFVVQPLRTEVVNHVRTPLTILQAAAILVLLLGCANVANLTLSRGERRSANLEVRRAIGATRGRIFRQLMMESGLLGVTSTVLASGLAWAMIAFLRGSNLPGIPRIDTIALSGWDLGWIGVLAAGSTLFFGVWPALRLSEAEVARTLNLRGGDLRGRLAIVGAETALAVLLAILSMLVVRSYQRLAVQDPGFAVEDVLTLGINLPSTRYEAPLGTAQFLELLEARLEQERWIAHAGSTWPLPLEGQLWAGTYRTVNTPDPKNLPMADYRLASPGLLDAFGLRLLEGRNLSPVDSAGILVNRTLARNNWPESSALGQSIQLGGSGPRMRVVGVLQDIGHPTIRRYGRETVYLPMYAHSWADWEIFVVIRTLGDPAEHADEAREIVHALDPELGVGKVVPMARYRRLRQAPNAFAGRAIGFFAAAAFLMAIGGVYGVVSYGVVQRRKEMAIRLAVGAGEGSLFRMMMRRYLSFVVGGAALGVGSAILVRDLLGGLLYGIPALDPVSFALPLGVVVVAAVIAAWIPTRRVTRWVTRALTEN